MKKRNKVHLLKKLNSNYIKSGFIFILISIPILYFLIKNIIRVETDEGLYSVVYQLEKKLKRNEIQNLSFSPVFEVVEVISLHEQNIGNVLIYDELQNEHELYRELNSFTEYEGLKYRITARTLVIESMGIIFMILISYVLIIILALLIQYFFRAKLNRNLWHPFFRNIEQIKKFSVKSKGEINLIDSNIIEFHELNNSISTLTNKVVTDYVNLKSFVEDISHEIQTPLAIIHAKIENIIINNKVCNQKHLLEMTDIQSNVKRMSKLNKNLVLLAKIENEQFITSKKLNVGELVKAIILDLEDLCNLKKIHLNVDLKTTINVVGNAVLLHVLISNLVNNAIKHSSENGEIKVVIHNNIFSIANLGAASVTNPEKLFERFYKEDINSKSLGLGLAIAKKICDYYNFDIQYSFNENYHKFSVVVQ